MKSAILLLPLLVLTCITTPVAAGTTQLGHFSSLADDRVNVSVEDLQKAVGNTNTAVVMKDGSIHVYDEDGTFIKKKNKCPRKIKDQKELDSCLNNN